MCGHRTAANGRVPGAETLRLLWQEYREPYPEDGFGTSSPTGTTTSTSSGGTTGACAMRNLDGDPVIVAALSRLR